MQLLFVDAVQIARDLPQVNRDPLHGHPHSSTVLVTSVRGYDLGDPTILLHPDGSITRPPPGGLGSLACADNVNTRSPSHDRIPKHCRCARRRTTIGNVKAAGRTTARTSLDMHGHLANA
eukprot:3408936-Pyramimonas_sp.AAC.1